MSKYMNFTETSFKGLYEIKRKIIGDNRGQFTRLYCVKEYEKFIHSNIMQTNFSLTNKKGTIRGLHYQVSTFKEDKIITCLEGKVFDVAVDLRKDSKTFLKWYSIILDNKLKNSLLIPKGFAHGFQSLTQKVCLLYFHTNFYNPNYEKGINPLDKKIDIKWPLEIKNISKKDKSYSFLQNDFIGI